MTAALQVVGLSAGYGEGAVIRDVELNVEPGEAVAMLGPNGAGKTTTLRAICGMIPALAGEVRCLGERISGFSSDQVARHGIAHVREGRGIFVTLTVADHFRLQRVDPREGYELFPALEPLASRRAGVLSGGEQQMLALACGMVRRPRVLLVDELSLGLAPVIVQRLLGSLSAFVSESGAALVLVEQHIDLALDHADRAVVLRHGTVAVEGSAAELRRDWAVIAASYMGETTTAGGPAGGLPGA